MPTMAMGAGLAPLLSEGPAMLCVCESSVGRAGGREIESAQSVRPVVWLVGTVVIDSLWDREKVESGQEEAARD